MPSSRRPRWHTLFALAALCVCLSTGWGDVDPPLAQDALRQVIRVGIQELRLQAVRLEPQCVVPAALLVFLLRGAVFDWQRRHGGRR